VIAVFFIRSQFHGGTGVLVEVAADAIDVVEAPFDLFA
jgi:hypothetical protein